MVHTDLHGKALLAASRSLRQGFRNDQSRTLQDLFLRVDVVALSSPEELDNYRGSLTSRQGMGNIKCYVVNLLVCIEICVKHTS